MPSSREFTQLWGGCGGGVNLKDAPNQLAKDQLIGSVNVILDEQGGGAKRLGCASKGTVGGSSDRIISSWTYYRGSTAPQVLIHTSAGKLYYTNDPTATTITWTQIVTGLSTTVPMSWQTFGGKVYMSNGVDDYASWDGASRTTFGSAPKGKYLMLWKDTMWMSGIAGNDDRVYSAAAGDPETWPIASWVDLAKGDGDIMMALNTDGTTLVVFKRLKTIAVYDPVSFANRLVDYEKGCEGHFSVIYAAGNIFFLSRDGICRYLGDAPSEVISGNIEPIFDPSVLNIGALSKCWAYSHQNRIGWALPEVGSSVPTIQVEFYPRLERKPWVIHRMPIGCFTKFRSGTVERLYGGSTGANKCLEVFAGIGTDDGAAFQSFLQKGWDYLGQPADTKYIRFLSVLGRGKFIIQLRKDFEVAASVTKAVDFSEGSDLWTTADTWGSGTWGPSSSVSEVRVGVDLYPRWVSIVISDTESASGVRPFDVGAQPYNVIAGEWSVLGVLYEGAILGRRH